jgi:hypothetical protein
MSSFSEWPEVYVVMLTYKNTSFVLLAIQGC